LRRRTGGRNPPERSSRGRARVSSAMLCSSTRRVRSYELLCRDDVEQPASSIACAGQVTVKTLCSCSRDVSGWSVARREMGKRRRERDLKSKMGEGREERFVTVLS